MTVDFIDKEFWITEKETYDCKPYIGYITPNGNLINYNKPFGESGHDGWDNRISNTFLDYVSYIIKNNELEEYVVRGMGFILNENTEEFAEFLERLEKNLKYPPSYDDTYGQFRYQFLLFFKKAYANKNFFEAIGRKIEVMSEEEFMSQNTWIDPYDFTKKHYVLYLMQSLMQHFKDIAVSYLGYDAIERFQPNGELINIPSNPKEYPSYGSYANSYFYRTPRIITTSYNNINERFYNYLLMEWSIHKIPRYVWSDNLLRFEQEPTYMQFFQSEKEKILGEEINSIKKLVLLKDRYKYFR